MKKIIKSYAPFCKSKSILLLIALFVLNTIGRGVWRGLIVTSIFAVIFPPITILIDIMINKKQKERA